ncbi:MAG: hypothetical protein ACK5TO_15855 [Planctomycetaceae bacterium]
MPDPGLFVLALVVAALVSLLMVRAAAGLQRDAAARMGRGRWAAWLGLLAGLAAGWDRLGYAVPWPPATGLDRLLVVVLPAVMVLDLLVFSGVFHGLAGGVTKVLQRGAMACLPAVMLGLVSMVVPLVLLWGSVYLRRGMDDQTLSGQGALLLASGSLLGLGGVSLQRLSRQPAGNTVPISLMLALLSAGGCILLGGYIKGGAVAFPLAGVLLGGLLATIGRRSQPVFPQERTEADRVLVTLGTVSLYGVLLVGCAFGRLPGGRALLVGLAPLLGWISEWPRLRFGAVRWIPWLKLTVIIVPLGLALVAAKRDFERTLGPLVGLLSSVPLPGEAP